METEKVGFAAPPTRADVRTWALPLAPPLLYLTVLAVRYALTRPACAGGTARVLLEVVAGLGLLAVAVPGVLAWRSLGRGGLVEDPDEPGYHGTRSLLLQLAVLGSAFFTLVTLATWIPSWVLSPCHG